MRVAAYIRVSSEEQAEGYSLDAQREAIRAYCRLSDWDDVAWYAEAVSAWTDEVARRPVFARMLGACRAGEHDVVIVHKLDRFARSVIVTLTELRTLERADVAFVSIAQRMDFSTPVGRVVLAVLAAFAQYYSENLSAEVKKGLDEKRRRGEHVGGIPWGAQRIDGRLILDPDRAELLREIYARAATHSDQQLAAWLNRRGVPSRRGRRWGPRTIHRMRFEGGDWLVDLGGEWPALVQRARQRPRQAFVMPTERRVFLLSGLLRCPCGATVRYHSPGTMRSGRTQGLHCNAPRPSCGHGLTTAPRYEQAVEAAVLALDPGRHFVEETVDVEAARAALVARRARVGDRYEAGEIGRREWLEKRAAIAAE
ncbi:MAG: recombinase family protein, partial [Chloroflexota bacterium]|nr:recombinase family protein [Chloroflexota bacterium]